MSMRSDPRNFITLYKCRSNLLDAANVSRFSIVIHDQVRLNGIRGPSLTTRHWRNKNLTQLTRLFQATVPLSDRTLPFTNSHFLCFWSKFKAHLSISIYGRSNHIHAVIRTTW